MAMEEANENVEASAEMDEMKTASEVVENSMSIFAQHTQSHQLPSYIDGLKVVNRRILWIMKDVTQESKCYSLAGRIMHLHPHGDMSIIQAINKMMQPFNNVKELIDCRGNYGSYAGDPAGAPRYIELKRSEFAHDVYFKNVNTRTFDYVVNEYGDGVEPKFLIPKIPMALLTSVFGISIGYRPHILPLNFNSVCELTLNYIDARKSVQGARPVMRNNPQWFYPDSFVPNLLRNGPELREYAKQDAFTAPTTYDGTMEVRNNMIVIRTLPHSISPEGTAKQLTRLMDDKSTYMHKCVQQVRATGRDLMHLEIVLKRNVDPFQVMDYIKQKIRFTATMHPNLLWSGPDGELESYDIQQVLEAWYKARRRSVLSDFKHTQNRLVEEYRQLEAKYIVRDSTQEVLDIIRGSDEKETALNKLVKRFQGLSYTQAEYLTTLQIGQLTGSGIRELERSMEEIQNKLKNLRNEFLNVDEVIKNSVKELQDKYGNELSRKASLPTFKGAVLTGTGVIQFWNETEMHNLMLHFRPERVNIIHYPKGSLNKYLFKGNSVITESEQVLPKESPGENLMVSRKKFKHTICKREGSIYRLNGLTYKQSDNIQFIPVADYFTGITEDGQVNIKPVTDIPLRKQMVSSGVQTTYKYVSNVTDERIVIVHGNTNEPNILRMDLAEDGSELHRLPLGTVVVIGVFNPDNPFVINIPEECRKRNNIFHLFIQNAEKILNGYKSVRIYLSKKNTENGWRIKKSSHGLYGIYE